MRFKVKEKEIEIENQLNDFEFAQTFEKNALILESDLNVNENSNFTYYVKKIFTNLSIFAGVFLTFGSSLVIYQVFIADFSGITHPIAIMLLFGYLLVGLFLTFLGVGKSRSDWKLYLFVPLFSFLLGFFLHLRPKIGGEDYLAVTLCCFIH